LVEVERENQRRQAERSGGRALRAFLESELARVQGELKTQNSLVGPPSPQDSIKRAQLQRQEGDLKAELEKGAHQWRKYWKTLGDEAASSLKDAGKGFLEGLLSGQETVKSSFAKLLGDLRSLAARALSNILVTQMESGFKNLFKKVLGNHGGSEDRRAEDGGNHESEPGPTESASDSKGTSAGGKSSGLLGFLNSKAGKLATTVGLVGGALSTLVGAFKNGGEGIGKQMPLIIAALIQLALAILLAKGQIEASAAGPIGIAVAAFASLFSHDSPMQDSRARSAGFEARFGASRAQVGRWGFDFETAWLQGRGDRLKGMAASVPAAPSGGAPSPSSFTVNATQNIYGNISHQVDVDRSNADLAWIVARRLNSGEG
jgi:hypothetical protein